MIQTTVKNGAIEGIELIDNGSTLTCKACEQAKATCKQIRRECKAPLADAFGVEVDINLWGLSPMPSLGGRGYYVTFMDDYSRYTKLTPLQSKDKTLDAYKSFAAWAQTQHGAKIKRLQSDHSGKYTSTAFTQFLKSQGTEHCLTTHDTPQHIGVAEALNCQLVEHLRMSLIQASLLKFLWAEAAQFAIWVKNRTPTKVLGYATPFEQLTRQKPNLAGVPEWGQHMWVYDNSGSKLNTRTLAA